MPFLPHLRERESLNEDSRVKAIKQLQSFALPQNALSPSPQRERERALLKITIGLHVSLQTIFEIGPTAKNSRVRSIMVDKRSRHEGAIQKRKDKVVEASDDEGEKEEEENVRTELEQSSQVCKGSVM
jgi:hypothetical protein